MADWQLIETAPKDGGIILLAFENEDGDNDVFVGEWFEGKGWFILCDKIFHPTHWMPLPDPPKAS